MDTKNAYAALLFPLAFALLLILGLAYAMGWLTLPALPELNERSSLGLVFLTGLSVGGLSCLAVQGGLLATTISARAEARESAGAAPDAGLRESIRPVAEFLTAKVAVYTLLGALLGYFGSKVPGSLQGWLMVAVGLFMLAIVGQMYDAHPLLRHLALKPPKALRRRIRGTAKSGSLTGPWLLGAMTVFIPCGVTLAMVALAVASESPMRGALIMLAFTLGTSPLFFLLGFAAGQFSRLAYTVFQPVAAITIAIVAVFSIRGGVKVIDWSWLTGGPAISESAAPQADQQATIYARDAAYEPALLQIQADRGTQLTLTNEGSQSCTRAFTIPSLGIELTLPVVGSQTVALPPMEAGSQIPFTCSMGMYSGKIEVIQ